MNVPRKAKELTDLEVRKKSWAINAEGEPTIGRHSVGGVAGLHLAVYPPPPSGAAPCKAWVYRKTVSGKRREFGLGTYPSVTLSAAREKARELLTQIQNGIDPLAERTRLKQQARSELAKLVTFESVAAEYVSKKASEYKSPKQTQKLQGILKRYVLPYLGELTVSDIDHSHVVSMLTPIWGTKTETASRARIYTEGVLSLAEVKGLRAGKNPAAWAGNLKLLFPSAAKIKDVQHQQALPYQHAPVYLDGLLAKNTATSRAIAFLMLTAARPAEVRGLMRSELDLEAKQWTLSAKRAKNNRAKEVPLSDAALHVLSLCPPLGGIVFSSTGERPLSDSILPREAAGMAAQLHLPTTTAHGLRTTFRTWAQDKAGSKYRDEVIELALGHVSTDATRAAYARSDLFEHRRELMQDWADYLQRRTVD